MVVLRINNIYTDILGDMPDGIDSNGKKIDHWKGIETQLRFRPQGYQFSPQFNKKYFRCPECKCLFLKHICPTCSVENIFLHRQWDGWKKQFWRGKKRTYFPTGLLSLVIDYFKKLNIPFIRQDTRIKPAKNAQFESSGAFIDRDYQVDAIKKAVQKTRGIMMAATGSGKTIMAGGIMKELNVLPVIFFVTSIDLLTQAKESFEQALMLDGKPLKVGQIGGGVVDIRDVNVMTIQTAVRALGKRWDQTYKFDTESANDPTPIAQYRDEIVGLLHTCRLSFSDECVTGDAVVITRKGPVRIDKLFHHIGQDILSVSNNSAVWKKITHFYSKGRQKVIKIKLTNGKTIKCTKDHLIMTRQGWKSAQSILVRDLILCSANAVVDKKLMSEINLHPNTPNTYLGIKLKNEQKKNGNENSKKASTMPPSVNAGVNNRCSCIREHWNHSLKDEGIEAIEDSFMGTINDPIYGTSNYPNKRNKQYLAPFLETHPCRFLRNEVRIRDFIAITVYNNLAGLNSNRPILRDYRPDIGNMRTGDMENNCRHSELAATQSLKKYIPYRTTTTRKGSHDLGSTKSDQSDLRGGFVMTAAEIHIQSLYTLRASHRRKSLLSQIGSPINMDQLVSIKPKNVTKPYILKKEPDKRLYQKSRNSSPPVCDIKYVAVESVALCDTEELVYDITVEDSHCFFANNMLVHNCQHWRAATCQLITRELHQAYYTYGLSATPYRDDGDDMLIQACFGRTFVEISASLLIRQEWLMRPDIKMVHIRTKKSVYKTWQKLYKDQVVDNKYYNESVAKIATAYINRDRLVLVLVQQVNHGKALARMIPGAVFLSGISTKKKRETGIKNLRNKYISCIVSTAIFDEGIDIKPLDTVILAGGGKSRTRAMQRIGRIIRPFEGKTKATAIDFYIHQKYLENHAIERMKMYVTEPEYVVEEIDPRLL